MRNIIINEIIFIIVLQLCSVLIAVIAIIIYRVSVTLIMYQVASRWDDKPQFLTVSNTKLLISMSAACMNLLVIIIFNKVSKYIIISLRIVMYFDFSSSRYINVQHYGSQKWNILGHKLTLRIISPSRFSFFKPSIFMPHSFTLLFSRYY